MKFMLMVKASKDSEAGVIMLSEELLPAMGKYNETQAALKVILNPARLVWPGPNPSAIFYQSSSRQESESNS